MVDIQESRPMSALKRFMLFRVVKPHPQFTAPLPAAKNYAPFILHDFGTGRAGVVPTADGYKIAPSILAQAAAPIKSFRNSQQAAKALSTAGDAEAKAAEPYILERGRAAASAERSAEKSKRRQAKLRKKKAGDKLARALDAKERMTDANATPAAAAAEAATN